MELSVHLGSQSGLDTATIVSIASALLSLVTTVIAVAVAKIARNLRRLEWYRSQNDAWNQYNAQKLGPHGDSFAIVDAIASGCRTVEDVPPRKVDDALLSDWCVKAALFQRLNILEFEYLALALNLIDGAGSHYLLNEIRRNGENARYIVNFMIREGYDPEYIIFYRRVARWYRDNPGSLIETHVAKAISAAVCSDRHWRTSGDDALIMAGQPL